MKLESLRLKHFMGIQRGLGLDEIHVDFSGVSGLIALDGPNGAGKSTVLENLHAYNQLASREGALTHHVLGRAAEKELSFSYAGDSFRTLLKIDSQSEKSEGYIWRNGKSEVNGKISSYARFMKELLGSPELFFASNFCAQNSRKLSDMTTGELKRLFAEFLRLDRLQTWEQTAKQAGNILSGKVGQIDILRASLILQAEGVGEALLRKMDVAENIQDLEAHREQLKESIFINRGQIDDLKATISKNATAEARKAATQQTIDRLTKDMAREKEAAEGELEAIRGKYRELSGELTKCNAILKDREAILGAAEREKQVSGEVEAITVAMEDLSRKEAEHRETARKLEREFASWQNRSKDLKNDPTLRELEKGIEDDKRRVKELEEDREAHDLFRRIENLKLQIQTLDLKDPSCQSSTCSFILEALKAQADLPKLEAEFQKRNAEIKAAIKDLLKETDISTDKVKARYEFVQNEAARLGLEMTKTNQQLREEDGRVKRTGEEIAKKRQDLARLRLELPKLKALSSRVAEVQVAEARKADLEQDQKEEETRGKEKRAAWEGKQLQFETEIELHKEDLADIEKTIDHKAEAELTRAQESLKTLETKTLPATEAEIQAAREALAKLQGDLERMREAEQELASVNGDRERLQQDVSEWLYLKDACGRNGLQAMEIDGAAPLITGYANDLLEKAFGLLYSVRLRTQDGEGREVLDIVTIGEDGGEVLLDNLSGGQKVWILMALRLAMTLLSKEKSGHRFQTAFADELDGALDPENAVNFVNMYRSFMKVGGFQNFLFISHRAECKAMADHILSFEPGKEPFWR